LRLLCDSGALPTTLDEDGQTALHIAARWGHANAVTFLLEKGVDPNAVDKCGKTPLHAAADACECSRSVEVLRLLGDSGALYTALDEDESLEVIRLLCDSGALTTTLDEDGQTALHIAAEWGHADAVTFLLEKGVDPNAVDKRGKTPLD
ncbi:ankyrin, partial [Auricularia subglabra TFB-10046 SS5]